MITLTCLSQTRPDGLGAQLQRRAAVFEIATALDFDYLNSPILDFGFNPGDGVGSDIEIKKSVLFNINNRFSLPSKLHNDSQSPLTIARLDALSTLKLLKQKAFREECLVNIQNPFPFFDRKNFGYKNVLDVWSREFPTKRNDESSIFTIDVHIRRAVTPKKTKTTTSYIRHMPTNWYRRVCEAAVKTLADGREVRIRLHTDGTKAGGSLDINAMPLDDGTKNLWIEQGFLDRNGNLMQNSEELSHPFQHLGTVEVIQELRPDLALNSMIEADLLVGAKSSFSFIAGLARKNRPVIFSKFWHRNPSNWITLQEGFREDELKKLLLRYRLSYR
jgi:hypothetical protein